MGYSTQQGETAQPQRGGTFEGGQTSGITSTPQKGGVFDGVVVVDGPAGPAGPPGPVGPTINITAQATATQGATASAAVTTSIPSAGTENLAFSFVLPQGGQGPAGTVAVGTVTANKLAPNATPTVMITDTGSASSGVLNFIFGIPQGAQGDLAVGTVTTTTGSAGTQANVTITEEVANPGTYDFAFTIPRGNTGAMGDPGAPGQAASITAGTATALPAGSNPTVTNSGTTSAAVFNFGIPTGPQGAKGDTGTPGAAGRSVVSITASGATVVNNTATVTLSEIFSDSATPVTTTFSFPVNNNFSFGAGNPIAAPTIIPGLYLNSTDRSLWAYLTNQWVLVLGGSTTTIVTNADGTITVTDLGGSDYDVKIAKNGAVNGQFLIWNDTNNKWTPGLPTVVMQNAQDNRMLTTVQGVQAAAEIITAVDVITSGNTISVSVNGVDAIDEPIVTSNSLNFNTANNQLTSNVNGIISNAVTIASGLGSINLQEPAWRTVTTSSVGSTQTITVKDNVQNPVSVFAGTATPQYLFVVPTDIGNATAGVSTITMNSVNIDGVFTTQTYTATVNQTAYDARTTFLYLRSPPANRFWFNEVGETGTDNFWSLFNNSGVTNGFYIQYTRSSNGTRNPVHANSTLSFTFSGFTGQGATPRVVTATLNQSQGPNTDAPVWRNLNISDIEPLFTNYPANGQLASWSNNKLNWITQAPGSVTTLTQGNGITITDAGVGIDHAYTVAASLSAQDNGAALPGNYYTLNLGSNLTGSVSGGVLTINATGGGGGGGVTTSPAWASGGTTKQAYNNATGPTQGTVNSQGVVITITASTNVGQVTAATVSFNGTAATGTYASTGTFPTYTITIPAGSIPAAAQTASAVTISINGTYDTVQTIIDGGMLTNSQPIPATSGLTATGQTLAPRAYYATPGTGTITASGTGTITTINYSLDGGDCSGWRNIHWCCYWCSYSICFRYC